MVKKRRQTKIIGPGGTKSPAGVERTLITQVPAATAALNSSTPRISLPWRNFGVLCLACLLLNRWNMRDTCNSYWHIGHATRKRKLKQTYRCQKSSEVSTNKCCIFCFIFSWHENNVIRSLKVMSVVGNTSPLQEGCNSLTCWKVGKKLAPWAQGSEPELCWGEKARVFSLFPFF